MQNPQFYMRFAGPRLRPGMDLLQAVLNTFQWCSAQGPAGVKSIVDLGCGNANLTVPLVVAFPSSRILGVDASENMLVKGKEGLPLEYESRISFMRGTFEDFAFPPMKGNKQDEETLDLIFSNAAFHWATNHDALLPAILKKLTASTGVLAFQIPDSRVQPSHVLMKQAAKDCGLLEKYLQKVRIPQCYLDTIDYYNILAPLCSSVDMWRTTYSQPLTVDDKTDGQLHPVAQFYSSTGLEPYLEALGGFDSDLSKTLLDRYNQLLDEKYPIVTGPNGVKVVFLEVTRLFVVAVKK